MRRITLSLCMIALLYVGVSTNAQLPSNEGNTTQPNKSSVAGSTSTQEFSDSSVDLVDFLIAKIDQARNQFGSIKLSYERIDKLYISPNGPLESRYNIEIDLSGDEKLVRRHFLFSNAPELATRTTTAVFNDRYIGIRKDQDADAYIAMRSEPLSSFMTGQLIPITANDFLLYGFGSGDETLKAARAVNPAKIQWKARKDVDADGNVTFEITRYTRLTPEGIPTTLFRVDPSRGYLITEVLAYSKNGSLGIRRQIEVNAIGHKPCWVPVRVIDQVFEDWDSPTARATWKGESKQVQGHRITRESQMTVSNVEVDCNFGVNHFGLGALGLRDHDQIIVAKGDSLFSAYYYGGEILSIEEHAKILGQWPQRDGEISKEQKTTPLNDLIVRREGLRRQAETQAAQQPLVNEGSFIGFKTMRQALLISLVVTIVGFVFFLKPRKDAAHEL